MFAAALRHPSVVYREEQNFAWWVYASIAFMVALGLFFGLGTRGHAAAGVPAHGGLEIPIVLVVGLLLPAVLIVGVLRMTTEVDPTEIRIWFGWVPTFQKSFPIAGLSRVEVVSYRPIVEYGGWGIRVGRSGERAYNARGNRGVRLTLVDGSTILIGSQRPEELASTIELALHPEL